MARIIRIERETNLETGEPRKVVVFEHEGEVYRHALPAHATKDDILDAVRAFVAARESEKQVKEDTTAEAVAADNDALAGTEVSL